MEKPIMSSIEVSDRIVAAAYALLEKGGVEFPVSIPSAPAFHLAPTVDSSVQPFGGLVYKGVEYAIGPRNQDVV